jgi:membrane protein implicated in regulation of membrane protease activity
MATSIEVKTGWQTTEFWGTVAAALIPLLNQAFGWHLPVEVMVSVAGSVAAYVVSRGWVKASS